MNYENLKERSSPWLAPVSTDKPAGTNAKQNDKYQFVQTEASKLDSPTGGAPDWDRVVSEGSELLQKTTKDLLIASYLGYGLYSTRGLAGLTTGAVMLTELVENYWPTLFPEASRMRGRGNALAWFSEHVVRVLPACKVGANDRDELAALGIAIAKLNEVSRAKLDAHSPSWRPLQDAIERLRLSLPAPAPEPAQEQPKPASQPAPATQTSGVAQATPAAAARQPEAAPAPAQAQPLQLAAPAKQLAAGADPTDFLRALGSSLLDAAKQLRGADAADPNCYRASRIGLWLHLSQPPPADAESKTKVPPPPDALRSSLELMAANGRWMPLLEQAESSMVQQRFWLDLQRYSAQALQNLGEGSRKAKENMVIELRSFLQRMPKILDLRFSDGSPFADNSTRAWLESEVLAVASPASRAAPVVEVTASSAEEANALAEAEKLAKDSRLPEAVALLQGQIVGAPTAAKRFRLRLELARICQSAGQASVAKALYESLEKESIARNLDEWDPQLVVACLSAMISAIGAKSAPDEHLARCQRLARLDPVAAMKVSR